VDTKEKRNKRIKELQRILDNTAEKNTVNPLTTPSECLQLETGIESTETTDRKLANNVLPTNNKQPSRINNT